MAASPSAARIGKYEVLDVIGEGGMGVVYKAIDPQIGRLVAIKRMMVRFSNDPQLQQRFQREARAAGTLQHSNIIVIYDLGEDGENPYIVMEYVDGESLEKMINRRKPLSTAQKLDIIIQVCDALHYAHQHGIVHRDIKPGNIILQPNGKVKLLDFGIAHTLDKALTQTGQIIGTLNYVSPEQLNGSPVDGRADIFATGIVLYQLLTYELPFDAPETVTIINKILREPAPSLRTRLADYLPEMDEILDKALAKDYAQRYQSAQDFALDLSRVKATLERETIDHSLELAREAIVSSDLARAKDLLAGIVKVDTQHPAAKQMLRDVQQLIEQQQCRERVHELRTEAEQALSEKHLDVALERINEAIRLSKTDPDLLSFRETVQQAMLRKSQAAKLVQAADIAREAGELDMARKAIEEALHTEPQDTKAKILHARILTELGQQTRQQQVRQLLGSARLKISSRNFTAAQELIQQAELLDPSNPEVVAVKELVETGRAQEARQQEIEHRAEMIQRALDTSEFDSACREAKQALQEFPAEPVLVRLSATAESRREMAERDRQIELWAREARRLLEEGKSAKALDVVSSAYRKYPTDPRIQVLVAQVNASSAPPAQVSTPDRARGDSDATAVSVLSVRTPVPQKAPIRPEDLDTGEHTPIAPKPPEPAPVRSASSVAIGNAPAEPLISAPPPVSVPVTPAIQPTPAPTSRHASEPAIAAPSSVPMTASAGSSPRLQVAAPAGQMTSAAPKPVATAIGVPGKSRMLVIGAAAALLVLVVALVARRGPAKPTLSSLEINAVPWARVMEVKPSSGKTIQLNEATPVRLSLPPGDYQIRMTGPNGDEYSGTIHIEQDRPAVYSHEFSAVDVYRILNAY
ncbi:MAG TPA: protein kinase [Terriglobales bacterium]|nr:protein kinase [Terriglobales bacterium]